jgi:hypothetical protein
VQLPLGAAAATHYINGMSKGRINSEGSMTTASRTLRAAGGSWLTVERASRRDENGVHIVRRSELRERTPPRERT